MSKTSIALIVAGAVALVVAVPVCLVGGYAARFVGNAADTAFDELNPKALLRKYEWFKDASAQLDKKQADIRVFAARGKGLADQYAEVPRKDWPRHDARESSQISAELAGVKASYNSLAAEYNAAMSKINYAFCNVGSLPKGASTPLPRSYKPYIES